MYSYLHIANARELSGKDYVLFRFLEMAPGLLAWLTLSGMVLASWLAPVGAAIFIILFDLYWLVKTVYLSLHLRGNWRRMKHHMRLNWRDRLQNLKWDHVWQIVILPFYNEPFEVIESSVAALAGADWPKERMVVALAGEKRGGKEARETSKRVFEKYRSKFPHLIITEHPADLEGELPGKGSNETWAVRKAEEYMRQVGVPPEHVLVSSFDIDTQAAPQYFLVLAYHFLTEENPHRASYQPVPLYNNNIWHAPAFSRVVAHSGTFWQMMQQERPERLATFSSHSMSLKALIEMDFWQKNIVSEDSRIFWNALLFYKGDYRSVPISYPVYMDANVGRNFWETAQNVYRQQRRWAWGAENFPYALFGFIKIPAIPFKKKFYFSLVMLEGLWSWATNALLMFFLGWLPLTLGGDVFNATLLSYNLPRATRLIMTFAMVGILTSIVVSTSFLPPRPEGMARRRYFYMAIQWLLMPITLIVFGAIPALEAETRLLLGGRFRLGFWVTPKFRNEVIQSAESRSF